VGVGEIEVVLVPEGPDAVSVRWVGPTEGHVDIGVGPSSDPAGHRLVQRAPAAEGAASVPTLPAGRSYVSLTSPAGSAVVADRRVRFGGSWNFRDLGGYPTASGGVTKSGLLYRSDSLHLFSAADLEAFDALGIETIYDLRRDDERSEYPGPRPFVSMTVHGGNLPDADPTALVDRDAGEQWLSHDYRGMLAQAGPSFGRLFGALAEPSAGPALFHCMGGKDRTGLASALLLSWLGVDRETVLDDYELTTVYSSPERLAEVVVLFGKIGICAAAADGMLSTPRWAMAETLALVDDHYGGIERYLAERAEMSPGAMAVLRERLVG
jgi:protein-tyrosine phosphatase